MACVAKFSISTWIFETTLSYQLSKIDAGIAIPIPAAVVNKASQMPPAKAEGSAWAPCQCLAFHVACGEGGMATNLDQFGPALELPWTRLKAPELTKN